MFLMIYYISVYTDANPANNKRKNLKKNNADALENHGRH